MVVGIAMLAAGCAPRLREGVRLRDEGVQFRIAYPGAASVAVAGDWNGWSATADPMVRAGSVWSLVRRLPPGEHAFMYVVDGALWLTPRNVLETAPDGFGGENGTILVP
jgi:1,4-alpha-glucan branching enzyme